MRAVRPLAPLLLAPLLAVAAPPLRAQRQSPAVPSDSAIRAIIDDRVATKLATGIVVGVLDPDGRRRVFASGASGTARPLDGGSLFEIGSITKTFTGIVLADMVARGEVRLDDPVSKYLPPTVRMPSRSGREITLLDLATHTSGLPRVPDNTRSIDTKEYTPELMYAFLSSHTLRRDPGAEFEYSNLGFMLLGHALTRRAGAASYEELVRARVIDPLGLRDTRVEETPAMRGRLALGHDAGGTVVPNWDYSPTLGGYGSLRSDADDMLAYLAANLAADLDSTRTTLAPVLHAAHVARRPAPPHTIGLGWARMALAGGDTVMWHNGGTGGYKSFVAYVPARRTAVVVLANNSLPVDDIGLHLAAPELPLHPPSLPAWVTLKAIALPAASLGQYVGTYTLSPTFSYVVSREGDQLFFQSSGLTRRPLLAEKADEFFVRGADVRVSFRRDPSGQQVTGLVARVGGVERGLAPKAR
ncbi:MAG TPA: serine hydrolase [Gemmatimonadaceae bacterium]|nr:serine hydrolase [Gemmatimonadaceae bacterium]